MFEDLSQNGPPLVFVVAKICPYCDSVTEIKEHKVFTASILATLCHLPHNINLLETFFLCFFHEQHELLFDHCLRKLQCAIQAELDCFGDNFVLTNQKNFNLAFTSSTFSFCNKLCCLCLALFHFQHQPIIEEAFLPLHRSP